MQFCPLGGIGDEEGAVAVLDRSPIWLSIFSAHSRQCAANICRSFRKFFGVFLQLPVFPIQTQKMDVGAPFGQRHQVDADRSHVVPDENRQGWKTVLHWLPSANNANGIELISRRNGKGQGKSFGLEKPILLPVQDVNDGESTTFLVRRRTR